MTVSARYQIDQKQVEAMDLTLSVTMKVSEWRLLKGRIMQEAYYETRHLVRAVNQALARVDEVGGKNYEYDPDVV